MPIFELLAFAAAILVALIILAPLFLLIRRQRYKAAKRDLLRLLAQADAPLSEGLRHEQVVRKARRELKGRRGEMLEDHLNDIAFDLSLEDLVRSRDYEDGEKLAAAARGEHPRRWRYYHLTEEGLAQASKLRESA